MLYMVNYPFDLDYFFNLNNLLDVSGYFLDFHNFMCDINDSLDDGWDLNDPLDYLRNLDNLFNHLSIHNRDLKWNVNNLLNLSDLFNLDDLFDLFTEWYDHWNLDSCLDDFLDNLLNLDDFGDWPENL